MTAIKDSVVLVSGGSRGIGKALVDELFRRGAAKVYATARDPRTVTHPDAVPLKLEVTDEASVADVAARASDVTILINNAVVFRLGGLQVEDFFKDAHRTIFRTRPHSEFRSQPH